MNEPALLFLATALSVLVTAAVTVYGQRRTSPNGQAKIFESSDNLIGRLETRVERLENRVAQLERENDAYHRLHGPLPPGVM